MNDQAKERFEYLDPDIATRLREARENAGMSRAELARQTDIPAKSIEKFEYGTQEPSVSRIKVLCKVLNVSREWVEGEDDAPTPSAEPTPKEKPQSSPVHNEVNENAPMVPIREALDELDDMQEYYFEGVQRQAIAMAEKIIADLKYLEPDELMDLAEDRGLFKGECLTLSDIQNFFVEELEKAQVYCGQVEERILDTAILGVDLYAIEHSPLVDLAERLGEDHNIDAPAWGGLSWGDYEDFVPLIRPLLRSLAIMGKAEDFEDQEAFPRRS